MITQEYYLISTQDNVMGLCKQGLSLPDFDFLGIKFTYLVGNTS